MKAVFAVDGVRHVHACVILGVSRSTSVDQVSFSF
jgi:hypothetical protein